MAQQTCYLCSKPITTKDAAVDISTRGPGEKVDTSRKGKEVHAHRACFDNRPNSSAVTVASLKSIAQKKVMAFNKEKKEAKKAEKTKSKARVRA